MQTITTKDDRKKLWHKLSKEQQAEVNAKRKAGLGYDEALSQVAGVKVTVSKSADEDKPAATKPAEPKPAEARKAKAEDKEPDSDRGGGRKRRKRIERLIEQMDGDLDEEEVDDFAEAGYRAWLDKLTDAELDLRYERLVKEPEAANELIQRALHGQLDENDEDATKLLSEIEDGKWELVRVEPDEEDEGE